MHERLGSGMLLAILWLHHGGAAAQQDQAAVQAPGQGNAQMVAYPAAFFQRYSPNTALDMVNQLPGFVLDDGNASRGFGAAAGNVLINDRRPSAKQDLPSLILTRIPASQVERIEIIRGQIRDIDLQGRSQLANIVLLENSPAAIRWTANWRYNFDFKSTLEGSISIADRWRETDYNAGLDVRYFTRGDFTYQDNYDGAGVLEEKRRDDYFADGLRGSANLNTATWVGANFVEFNTTLTGEDWEGSREIRRIPQPPGNGFRDESLDEDFGLRQFELGSDLERDLSPSLQGKAILLYVHSDEDTLSPVTRIDSDGSLTLLRIVDTDAVSDEAIGRLEADWTGLEGHTLQGNLELAYNSLEGALFQTDDTGAGPEVVVVPGANTRVEEVRWDMLLKDTWSLGAFELDYGLGAEVSTITQTGDARQERDFFFLKPQAVLSHYPGGGRQTRLRLSREVAQLDFNDFISTTVFEDDDLALGNPDLRPDTTWVAELIHERRFSRSSVVKLVLFHHWITDVIDLLPVGTNIEVTGNIGDGKRYGAEIETSFPLDWLRLRGARLDIAARWQDSAVTDPVTGETRQLSDRTPPGKLMPLIYRTENEYALVIEYRQDFQAQKLAWGWDIRTRGERPRFRVDELDIEDEGTEFNIFLETTRWFGLKTRFMVENIFDLADTRERAGYAGLRSLSPLEFREYRERYRSARVSMEMSGSF